MNSRGRKVKLLPFHCFHVFSSTRHCFPYTKITKVCLSISINVSFSVEVKLAVLVLLDLCKVIVLSGNENVYFAYTLLTTFASTLRKC